MPDTPVVYQTQCRNCHAPVSGNFCSNCGQDVKDIRRPFFFLLKDAVRVVFELDGRAYRTLWLLFTRPGFLTREYVSGRRESYTPPLRLFLVISIGFFLLVSVFASLQSVRAAIAEQNQPSTPTTSELITLDGPGEDEDNFEQIYELIENFSLPFLSDSRNQNLRLFMRRQAESNINDIRTDPAEYFYGALDYITVFILIMLPILALIQKLLYLRSKRFYVEHLILTLHNHAFLILAIFLAGVLGQIEDWQIVGLTLLMNLAGIALNFWIVAYLFLCLHNFFEQGYLITTVKFITMAVIYSVVTAIGIFCFAAILFFIF